MPRLLNFSVPPTTRLAVGGVFVFSFLHAFLRYRSYDPSAEESRTEPSILVVVPALSYFFPWAFLTATFVESNIITLLLTAIVLLNGGRYLERAWSSRELAKFLAIVSVMPNIVAFFFCVFTYAITGYSNLIYAAIRGSTSIQSAFLVCFVQLVPEHSINLFKGTLHLRVKRLPAIYLLVITILAPFYNFLAVVQAWTGFLAAWTYLRFYKTNVIDLTTGTGMKGDASETFALAYFFPEPIQSIVAAISIPIFNFFCAIKVVAPFSAAEVERQTQQRSAMHGRAAPGGARAEAERRRALALKALDMRLASSNRSAQSPPAQDSIVIPAAVDSEPSPATKASD
ncbi:DUF1751-domain-containing protein [Saitoella complicata NRRL Y-17804]|uniref:DUF1751-domain-containing protein n=1 Tax=Saitoella complicata (strain BCRC 22490 / CBS 7301 / JCM 7358 / NBRC 10748 / NRRL Y-17804) TaxID=698492 RepID=A0A0E9NRG4_SAICN|nr:DUF1751-domain-containing protein [Saitoella complicata NRRL Y-17804]ODQ50757.1 DUF1751-domain-containing protein [Saitoella complicata NRRL Y-17804]GAO52015.1 hypothetical protein G7K_6103-t1 [Saitoella complicata NRRL Y-17804]